MQKLIIIFLGTIILMAGCDFIEKINPFTESIDTLAIYRQRQDSIRRAELLLRQQEAERRDLARADTLRILPEEAAGQTVMERYHLIVGAFRTQSYARDYHERIINLGHESRILLSDNDFHLVTIKSLNDYRNAINELRAVRDQGEHEVWLYISD